MRFGIELLGVGRIVCSNGSGEASLGSTCCEHGGVKICRGIAALEVGSVQLSAPGQECTKGGRLGTKKREVREDLQNEVGWRQGKGNRPRVRRGRYNPLMATHTCTS